MVNQIILPGLDHWWGGEVDPVGFTNRFDLVISTGQSNNFGMELGKVFSELFVEVNNAAFPFFLVGIGWVPLGVYPVLDHKL